MQHQQKYDIEKDMRYLQLLSQTFPNIAAAATEIINLSAILNLPKGTEHFIADIHGENEAFLHVIKNASGNIKRKVYELFDNTLREAELKELCTIIYYPEQKLEIIKAREKNTGWRIDYFVTSKRLDERISDAKIHTGIMGSDHCPVELDLR